MASKLPARRPTAHPPALITSSLAALEQLLGGRAVLVAALAHAPKSKDVDYLLGLLGDPDHATLSLADLCAMGGITAGELIDSFKAGELNRAQAISTREVGKALPGVVADTMRLAAPYTDTCYRCQGTGTYTPEPTKEEPNPSPGPCDTCRGSGQLVYKGDLDHKKLALELGKMTSKSSGVNVQVNQQNNAFQFGTAGGALEKLQEATDRILYRGERMGPPTTVPPVVEGEVAEDGR